MKKVLDVALTKLKTAYQRLEEGVRVAETDLGQDGVIQRFEFTFELLWKCLKISFEEKGLEARSPKDSLKVAFRTGLIKSEEESLFLNMLEDRNISSHVYDKQESRVIFDRIRGTHLKAIQSLIHRLENDNATANPDVGPGSAADLKKD